MVPAYVMTLFKRYYSHIMLNFSLNYLQLFSLQNSTSKIGEKFADYICIKELSVILFTISKKKKNKT